MDKLQKLDRDLANFFAEQGWDYTNLEVSISMEKDEPITRTVQITAKKVG